jgi:hypothetical protein
MLGTQRQLNTSIGMLRGAFKEGKLGLDSKMALDGTLPICESAHNNRPALEVARSGEPRLLVCPQTSGSARS